MQFSAAPATFAGPSNATRTAIRLGPTATMDLQLIEFAVTFDGTSATATPILVWLAKSASISGGTASAITLQATRDSTATADVTANTYTAEPTYTTQVALKRWYVPPTSGIVIQSPLGREAQRLAAASVGLELMLTSVTASGTPNVACYMEFQQGVS
jgi:hypothetical protein